MPNFSTALGTRKNITCTIDHFRAVSRLQLLVVIFICCFTLPASPYKPPCYRSWVRWRRCCAGTTRSCRPQRYRLQWHENMVDDHVFFNAPTWLSYFTYSVHVAEPASWSRNIPIDIFYSVLMSGGLDPSRIGMHTLTRFGPSAETVIGYSSCACWSCIEPLMRSVCHVRTKGDWEKPEWESALRRTEELPLSGQFNFQFLSSKSPYEGLYIYCHHIQGSICPYYCGKNYVYI